MLVMTLEEMKKFVSKTSELEVEVREVPEESLDPYTGLSYVNSSGRPTIKVTRAVQTDLKGGRVTKAFIRAFLLHEQGHLHVKEDKAPYKNEYNAHMWAINKALALGYKKVVASLREEIVSWQHLENVSHFRKYKRASDTYLKEQGFII